MKIGSVKKTLLVDYVSDRIVINGEKTFTKRALLAWAPKQRGWCVKAVTVKRLIGPSTTNRVRVYSCNDLVADAWLPDGSLVFLVAHTPPLRVEAKLGFYALKLAFLYERAR